MGFFPNAVTERQQPPFSKSASNRRTIILILVSSGIAILAAGGYLLYRAASWYSRHYLNIDQSQATFVASNDESVYRNPSYGVTLRLPGQWVQQAKTPLTNYCALRQPASSAFATFRAQFSSPQQTLDQIAGATMFGLIKAARFKLTSQDSLTVSGQEARRLTFEYTLGEKPWRMALLIMKKRRNIYEVTLVSPSSDDDSWKKLVDSLAQAVEIQ